MGHHITDKETMENIVFGGNSAFTLKGKSSRFTYKVKTPKGKQAPFFVKVLTGSNNDSDYSFAGTVFETERGRTELKAGRKGMSKDAPSVVAFQWFKRVLEGTGDFPSSFEFWNSDNCGRCGRKLTDPESIEAGIGPHCRSKMGL